MSATSSKQGQQSWAVVESNGFALPMTVFSLLRPGCKYVQLLVFALGRRGRAGTVRQLSFIHFARLAVISELPDHGQEPEYLQHPLQLFESNYNGSFASYIDTFVQVIPWKMKMFWGTSYGFPLRLPLRPFKDYIAANQFPIDHYYVANPDASVSMIAAAFRVAQANADFRRQAAALTPCEFAERFETFLTEVQNDL